MVELCKQGLIHVIIHENNRGTILVWRLIHKPVSGSSSTIAGHHGHPSAFAHTRDPTVNLQVDLEIPIMAKSINFLALPILDPWIYIYILRLPFHLWVFAAVVMRIFIVGTFPIICDLTWVHLGEQAPLSCQEHIGFLRPHETDNYCCLLVFS